MSTPANSKPAAQASGGLFAVEFGQMVTPLVSVIIPTYREAENLPILIPQVCRALARSGMTGEILVVDDNSPDDTELVCEKLRQEYPVRLLIRTNERGLSSAVIHGLQHAHGTVLLVMDADLSHPPEKVPELVAAVLEQQGDFVIGSRYVPGGTTDDKWSLFRWVNSQVATWLSRPLTTARDPMAGFFALSRQTFEQARQLNPIGYKIGLELIVKCGCEAVKEVPIHFQDRLHGESKLSLKEQLNYLRHLGRLYRFQLGQWFSPLAFAAVGASGVLVDLLLFSLLLFWLPFSTARGIAIWGAMTWNYFGNRNLTFADRRPEPVLSQYLKFCASCTLGAILSWSVSTALWQMFSATLIVPQTAALAGIIGGVLLNFLLSNTIVFRRPEPDLFEFLGTEREPRLVPESVLVPPVKSPAKSIGLDNTAAVAAESTLTRWWGGIVCLGIVLAMTAQNWTRHEIDGLDQAHNVLTSLFFYDLYNDRPVSNLVAYTFDYQRQYPALGLMFWPPLFHTVAGAAMLVTGPEVSTVYAVLALFAALLGVMLFGRARLSLATWGAVAAVAIAFSTPILFELSNSAMLEIPSLAVGMTALWMYGRLVQRAHWTGWGEAVLAGLCAAAIVYTKQPALFILAGIFLDVLISHRYLLRQKLTAVCVLTAAITLLPLVAFTLKYGHVNIAQSIGNQGNIYVAHHRVADRWSWEGWTYYLQLLPEQFSLPLLILSAVGLVGILCVPQLRQRHGIWLWTVLAWWLLFSYFDNKQVRFVAYVIPFLAVPAVLAVQWLWTRNRMGGLAGGTFAVFALLSNLQSAVQHPPQGYTGVDQVVARCLQESDEGHLVFFGEDHHLFAAQLRLADASRERRLLRGRDFLTADHGALTELLADTGVRWLLVDPGLPVGQEILQQLAATDQTQLTRMTDVLNFDNGRKEFQVILFRYNGPLADNLRERPQPSKFLGVAETVSPHGSGHALH